MEGEVHAVCTREAVHSFALVARSFHFTRSPPCPLTCACLQEEEERIAQEAHAIRRIEAAQSLAIKAQSGPTAWIMNTFGVGAGGWGDSVGLGDLLGVGCAGPRKVVDGRL